MRCIPVALVLVLSWIHSATGAATPVNVVLIMVDDMGYGDAGCYGNAKIATPHMDALAKKGLRCTDFYSAGAWCVPSRKGLMTGLHPYRRWLQAPSALAKRTTLAELLNNAGYATALLGKWHLGLAPGLHPLDQGFDYFFGTPGSNDVPAPAGKQQVYEVFKTATEQEWPVRLLRNRELVELPAKQSLFTQRYTQEAVRFIHENSGRPFFLYLAHNMPHVPLFASPTFQGRSKGGIYGDVIEELDWSVGKVIRALRDEGLDKRTLVIFTSDNGPWSMFEEFGGTAYPLRGEKGTGWEGGSAVPAIFYWPERIPPGVTDEFMVNLDLYATIAALTSTEQAAPQDLDSLDMSGVLLRGEPSPRQDYLFFSAGRWKTPFAFRRGRYKIHVQTNDRLRHPDTGAASPVRSFDPPLLFDLSKDRGETHDLSRQQPERAAHLKAAMRAAAKQLEMPRP